MNGFKFLYWDDYETPKGDNGGKSDGSNDTPQDDTEGSRSAKDPIQKG